MNIITQPLEQETSIVPSGGTQITQVAEVDMTMPLGEFVRSVYSAIGNNKHTVRSYAQAIGQFFKFLPGDLSIPQQALIPTDWLPLAEDNEEVLIDKRGRSYPKTQWIWRGEVAILRLVTAGMLDNFCAFLEMSGASGATIDNRKRAVKTMLDVATRDGYMTTDQVTRMSLKPYKRRGKRSAKTVGRRLSREEVRRLRAAIDLTAKSEGKALRDKAILDVMLFAALRRFEVANLNTSDFVLDGGRWHILVRQGKGDKPRRIKVHDELYKSLEAWLDHLGQQMGDDNGPLFTNMTRGGTSTGRRLGASVIGRLVSEYGFKAGIAPPEGDNILGAHDLRRTAARNAFDNGARLVMVQQFLGHSDPKTTARYIGAGEEQGNQAVDLVQY